MRVIGRGVSQKDEEGEERGEERKEAKEILLSEPIAFLWSWFPNFSLRLGACIKHLFFLPKREREADLSDMCQGTHSFWFCFLIAGRVQLELVSSKCYDRRATIDLYSM